MSTGGGTKAIVAAFAANLAIAVAKFAGFLVTGSSSMLAESIHSVADTGNQGLLLFGRKRAARAEDHLHPFGYGRERFFWAFVVALVLFTLGSLFAVYEGIHKISHPEPITSAPVAIGLLLFALVLEGFSLRTALQEAGHARGSRGLISYIRTAKNPELPVVLLEDMGAMAGLVVALGSLILAWKVDPVFDGWGTLVIGALLGIIAVLLAVEMKSLLIGEGASDENLAAITAAIDADQRVLAIVHLRTEHIGPEAILVATKLALVPGLDLAEIGATIDAIEAAIRSAVSAVSLIYVEPDLYRAPTLP